MREGSGPLLEAACEALAAADQFDPEAIEAALAPVLDRFEVKPGKLYQPIRVAITGSSVSPGIFESLSVLGRERSLKRIKSASERLLSPNLDE
jgi:glutamyl-tRNA synthetase